MKKEKYAPLLRRIDALMRETENVFVAIDGDAAAGKSTLAAYLQSLYQCNVLHMDHFFLRPAQRSREREEEPGGNVDYQRFLQEVLAPLREGKFCSFRPFDCQKRDFGDEITVEPRPLTIIEGSYSLHPALIDAYHIKLFLAVEKEEQMRRIIARGGKELARRFEEEWIPKEKRYFLHFEPEKHCDFIENCGILEERINSS